MKLTKDQKTRIADFLRDQDEKFGPLSPKARIQALSMLKTRIRQELFALKLDAVSDEQVESILGRMVISIKPKSDDTDDAAAPSLVEAESEPISVEASAPTPAPF